jgi:hypothetical protein
MGCALTIGPKRRVRPSRRSDSRVGNSATAVRESRATSKPPMEPELPKICTALSLCATATSPTKYLTIGDGDRRLAVIDQQHGRSTRARGCDVPDHVDRHRFKVPIAKDWLADLALVAGIKAKLGRSVTQPETSRSQRRQRAISAVSSCFTNVGHSTSCIVAYGSAPVARAIAMYSATSSRRSSNLYFETNVWRRPFRAAN